MNFLSAVNNIQMLAGGSIPGKDLLNAAQIVGVTIAGIGIVFMCLVLLVLVIMSFGKIFDSLNQKKAAKEAAAAAKNAPKTAAPAPKAAPVQATTPVAASVSSEDDDEVIAVISAVIAAMSAADGTTYKVRSVKPAASNSLGGRTAWAMDGRRNNVMPF